MNRNTTIGLVIAFGVLLLYVMLVQRPKDEAASGTPTPGALPSKVWSFTSDQVTGFSVVDMAEGQRIEVAKDAQGAWMVTAPESRRADDQQVSSAVGQLAGLSVSTSITQSTDLSPFGVLTPAYALGVRLADGSELKAAVGDKTPTGTAYYLLRDSETEVLVVYSSSIDGLIGLLEEPPYFVPTPTLVPTVALTATVPAPTATP